MLSCSSSRLHSVTNTQLNENKRERGSKSNFKTTRGNNGVLKRLHTSSEPRRHSDAGRGWRQKLETHNKPNTKRDEMMLKPEQ